MSKKAASEQEILAFLNYAVAQQRALKGVCRNARVTRLVARPPSPGWPNWDYQATCADPDKCAPILRKIARELGDERDGHERRTQASHSAGVEQ